MLIKPFREGQQARQEVKKMRLNVMAEMSVAELPIDYRRKVVSFFKSAFEEYDPSLFEVLYLNGNIKKNFTFATYFGGDAIVGGETVQVPQKHISFTISTPDITVGLHLYNALIARRGKSRPFADCGVIRIIRITRIPEKTLLPGSITCKTLSPIVVRDHNRDTGVSWYYTYESSDFLELLRRNLCTELLYGSFRYLAADATQLVFKPIRMKTTIVKSYDINIPAGIGVFRLEGAPALLQYLYMSGVGGRRGMGFGCIDLL